MLATRIIPCLDVEDGKVVKGIKFKNIRYAGDPVSLAQYYNDEGADEIIFLDIGATYRSRKTMLGVVEKVSRSVFIPLTAGGGVRSTQDIKELLNSGADKVSMCSAAIENPAIISEGASIFGSQCIVLSIDAKKTGNSWNAYLKGGRQDSGLDAVQWAKRIKELGAGEILLNSIDMDGTRNGYDLPLTKTVSEALSIPVIASGGAGNLAQIHDAIHLGKADAVLIASLLHYRELRICDIKQYLIRKGVRVR